MVQKDIPLTAPHDIPLEIQRMAKEAQIGELRKVYSASNRPTKEVGNALVLVGGSLLAAFVFMVLLLTVFAHIDIASFILPFGIFFLLPALLTLLPGCYMLLHRGIYPHWHIYLWHDGFVYEKGQDRRIFRWDQIVSIKGEVKHTEYHHTSKHISFTEEKITYDYQVRHQDGDEVKLSNIFPEIAELIDILLAESARQLAPQEVTVARPESTIALSNFALDQQGIGNEQEKVSWEEIREIVMKDGVAIVRKTL
ncbi:MAG: hypothetical protein H0W02_01185 [Ktedonobacteraceae bacterium]|nr:hypothetical protein [Ktedonobacteraceae bacterium]